MTDRIIKDADPRRPIHPDNDWGATRESIDAWFAKRFEGSSASDAAKYAAKRICMSYGIRGLADPAYIANVVQAAIEDRRFRLPPDWENHA